MPQSSWSSLQDRQRHKRRHATTASRSCTRSRSRSCSRSRSRSHEGSRRKVKRSGGGRIKSRKKHTATHRSRGSPSPRRSSEGDGAGRARSGSTGKWDGASKKKKKNSSAVGGGHKGRDVIVESETGSESECSDLDLTIEMKPIDHYVSNRPMMVQEMFNSITDNKLRKMLPAILQSINLDDLKSMCIDQLGIMSKKRIRRILDGDDPEQISSSGTEDSDSPGGVLQGEEVYGEEVEQTGDGGAVTQSHAVDSTSNDPQDLHDNSSNDHKPDRSTAGRRSIPTASRTHRSPGRSTQATSSSDPAELGFLTPKQERSSSPESDVIILTPKSSDHSIVSLPASDEDSSEPYLSDPESYCSGSEEGELIEKSLKERLDEISVKYQSQSDEDDEKQHGYSNKESGTEPTDAGIEVRVKTEPCDEDQKTGGTAEETQEEESQSENVRENKKNDAKHQKRAAKKKKDASREKKGAAREKKGAAREKKGAAREKKGAAREKKGAAKLETGKKHIFSNEDVRGVADPNTELKSRRASTHKQQIHADTHITSGEHSLGHAAAKQTHVNDHQMREAIKETSTATALMHTDCTSTHVDHTAAQGTGEATTREHHRSDAPGPVWDTSPDGDAAQETVQTYVGDSTEVGTGEPDEGGMKAEDAEAHAGGAEVIQNTEDMEVVEQITGTDDEDTKHAGTVDVSEELGDEFSSKDDAGKRDRRKKSAFVAEKRGVIDGGATEKKKQEKDRKVGNAKVEQQRRYDVDDRGKVKADERKCGIDEMEDDGIEVHINTDDDDFDSIADQSERQQSVDSFLAVEESAKDTLMKEKSFRTYKHKASQKNMPGEQQKEPRALDITRSEKVTSGTSKRKGVDQQHNTGIPIMADDSQEPGERKKHKSNAEPVSMRLVETVTDAVKQVMSSTVSSTQHHGAPVSSTSSVVSSTSISTAEVAPKTRKVVPHMLPDGSDVTTSSRTVISSTSERPAAEITHSHRHVLPPCTDAQPPKRRIVRRKGTENSAATEENTRIVISASASNTQPAASGVSDSEQKRRIVVRGKTGGRSVGDNAAKEPTGEERIVQLKRPPADHPAKHQQQAIRKSASVPSTSATAKPSSCASAKPDTPASNVAAQKRSLSATQMEILELEMRARAIKAMLLKNDNK